MKIGWGREEAGTPFPPLLATFILSSEFLSTDIGLAPLNPPNGKGSHHIQTRIHLGPECEGHGLPALGVTKLSTGGIISSPITLPSVRDARLPWRSTDAADLALAGHGANTRWSVVSDPRGSVT